MADQTPATNVKENHQDALNAAEKRIRAYGDNMRKIRNTTGWNLTETDRMKMAEYIQQQSQLTIDTLLGTAKDGQSQFTF
jgi:hypothetical protein